MKVIIATFNLKNDYIPVLPNHWHRRKEAVGRFFSDYHPDVVGTQELTAVRIVELLSMIKDYDFVGEGRGGGAKGEYAAILYRKDRLICKESGTFWLSRNPQRPGRRDWMAPWPRICTWALFASRWGEEFYCFNTHLDPVSYPSRKNSVELISRKVKEISDGKPVYLTGDFNAFPTSKTLRVMNDMNFESGIFTGDSYKVFVQGEPHETRTYHRFAGQTGGLPLDYIFASKDIQVEGVRIAREKVNGVFPSDHYPVIMDSRICRFRE